MLRENWLKSFGKDRTVTLLEEHNNLNLYVTRDVVPDPYGRQPMYHVWDGDMWAVCTPVSSIAYNKFKSLKEMQE